MASNADTIAMVMDHARNPRNFGPLEGFNGHARLTGPCGDTMELWLDVQEGVIGRVGFTTDGCGSSRACGSMATELIESATLEAARNLRPNAILDRLGGLPEAHCALLASTTIRAACINYSKSSRKSKWQARIAQIWQSGQAEEKTGPKT